MFTEGGMRILAHFMLPAVAFAIANQVGNHDRLSIRSRVSGAPLVCQADFLRSRRVSGGAEGRHFSPFGRVALLASFSDRK